MLLEGQSNEEKVSPKIIFTGTKGLKKESLILRQMVSKAEVTRSKIKIL